jgi:hypothetical protein
MMIGGMLGGADGGPLGPPEHCALRWRISLPNPEDID